MFMDVVHEYPDITVHLCLFHASIAEGTIRLIEHNAVAWITPAEISDYTPRLRYRTTPFVLLIKRSTIGSQQTMQNNDEPFHIVVGLCLAAFAFSIMKNSEKIVKL